MMAKTKQKKRFLAKIQDFFGRIDDEDQKKVFAKRWGSFQRFIAAYLSLQKKKGRGPDDNKWSGAG